MPRYAIYYVPSASSELYRFGSSVLGYDCYTGKRSACCSLEGMRNARWDEIVRTPRKYGFHATLKAPFHLSADTTEEMLAAELEAFSAQRIPIRPVRLGLYQLGKFVALIPEERSQAIDRLAADCVTGFDRFRAPMSKGERRRRAAGLDERQSSYLEQYGYPHVLDEFRFHMTLTGELPTAARQEAFDALRARILEHLSERTVSIDTISIVRQASESSPFRVMHRSALGAVTGRARSRTARDLQRQIADEWD